MERDLKEIIHFLEEISQGNRHLNTSIHKIISLEKKIAIHSINSRNKNTTDLGMAWKIKFIDFYLWAILNPKYEN